MGLPWNNIRLLYNGYGWVIGGEVDAAASNGLVYQPGGGGAGPVVFASWSELVTQLGLLRAGAGAGGGGSYAIIFDDSIVSPAVIPPGGPYDMTGVTWLGSNRTGPAEIVLAEIADGASFVGLLAFGAQLAVSNQNTVTPPCILAAGDNLHLHTASLYTAAGGVAMWSGAALGAGDSVSVFLDEYSSIGAWDVGPVIDFPVAGSILVALQQGGSTFSATSLVGGAGAVLITKCDTYLSLPPTFPGWLGTAFDPLDDEAATFLPRPYLAAPSPAALTAYTNDHVRLDASGGDIVQTLPVAAGQTGGAVVVSETGGGHLSVKPHAGDTLDGVAGVSAEVAVNPRGSVMLVSDGVTDWRRVASFTPTVVLQTNTPVRAIAAAFQPSTKFDCLVRYGVETVAGNFGVGAGDGYLELLCDAANPPTVPRDRSGAAGTAAAVVKVYGSVGFLVPAGWWVLLNVPPAINVTHVLVDQVEQLLLP